MMMARSEGSQFIAIQHNATNSDPQTAVCAAMMRIVILVGGERFDEDEAFC
jgi:hypothetical protein